MEEKMTTGQAPRQLISFVIDNSASVGKEKLSALMGGFRAMAAPEAQDPTLEWELSAFDAFAPAVVKPFDQNEIAPVYAKRIPLLGRAVLAAADRLCARVAALQKEGVPVYRPMLFILSDGFTLDDTEEMVSRLDAMEHAGEVTYLPFKLSPKLYTERMQSLDRVKHMIKIKEGHIPEFFSFVASLVEQRRALSPDAGLKFKKSDFEGWAEL